MLTHQLLAHLLGLLIYTWTVTIIVYRDKKCLSATAKKNQLTIQLLEDASQLLTTTTQGFALEQKQFLLNQRNV